jgi:hypothetical protein
MRSAPRMRTRAGVPWLTVVAVLLLVGLLLWLLVLRPLFTSFLPAWGAASWHLIAVRDGQRELVIGVEYTRCAAQEDAPPAARVSVIEDGDSVLVTAEIQGGASTPFGIGSGCAAEEATHPLSAELRSPLGTRALLGCRTSPCEPDER